MRILFDLWNYINECWCGEMATLNKHFLHLYQSFSLIINFWMIFQWFYPMNKYSFWYPDLFSSQFFITRSTSSLSSSTCCNADVTCLLCICRNLIWLRRNPSVCCGPTSPKYYSWHSRYNFDCIKLKEINDY